MLERLDPTVVVYADLESIRSAMEGAGSGTAEVAGKLSAFARQHGTPSFMGLYGELTEAEVAAVRAAGFEARRSFEDGDGSAPESIGIALDAAERLAHAVAPEVALLVSDDAQLSELVRRWRRRGTHVTVLLASSLVSSETARSADRAAPIEQLLAGSLSFEPIFVASSRAASEPRPVRSGATAPVSVESSANEMERLIVLMSELETHMPFVGMRWLKNKVLGPHNVGVSLPTDKQRLLNSAVDTGILETYRVDNRDGQGEPVTACRLMRENPQVAALLASRPETVGEPAPAH